MNYRTMNGTGIRVSDVCLGTMTFGAQTDENEALKITDYALSNGVNFVDTADAYNAGESEKIVGKALEGRREEIILATKVRFQSGDEINNNGLNRRHILKQIDKSLMNLQTDYIDLYYLHAMDNDVELEETFDTMTTLVRSGKVRYVGISNFPAWQLSEMLAIADKRNYVKPIVTQNMYNIITRDVEPELVPCIQKHHIGMTVYNPIAGGLLSGKYDFSNRPDSDTRFAIKKNYMDRYWTEENFEAIKKLENVAGENGMSLLELSLKWCLANSYVDSVICGVSKLDQIKQNIELVSTGGISLDVKTTCDRIVAEIYKKNTCYFK